MSQPKEIQQNNNAAQKSTKSKQEIAKQKENTNAWLKKQQEKKKKKLQQQQQKPVELDEKALEKAKRKQQKRLQRQQMLKQQGLVQQKAEEKKQAKPTIQKKQEQKVQQKKSNQKVTTDKPSSNKQIKAEGKKNAKKTAESSTKLQQTQLQQQSTKEIISTPSIPKPVFTQLLTLQQHLRKSLPAAASTINKPQKTELIYKYLEQYIHENDTILILTRTDSWQPLADKCGRRVFLYPIHQQFQKCQQCQNIVCTYEDVAYLMEGTLTKIFVELDVVFANGTGLTKKGNQNIIDLANQFKIPVIGFTGTWNFNAWNFLSIQTFLNKYGETYVQKYDILENDQFQIIVLEIGSVIPRQISGHLENLSKIYRGCDLKSLKW